MQQSHSIPPHLHFYLFVVDVYIYILSFFLPVAFEQSSKDKRFELKKDYFEQFAINEAKN